MQAARILLIRFFIGFSFVKCNALPLVLLIQHHEIKHKKMKLILLQKQALLVFISHQWWRLGYLVEKKRLTGDSCENSDLRLRIQTTLEIFTGCRYYDSMSHSISFRDVTHLNFLQRFSCDIEAGCSVLIVTSHEDENTALTRLITGLSRPASGFVLVNGHDVAGLEKADLYHLRQHIGVIPSNGGLVSNLKLWENITMPLLYNSGEITPEDENSALDYLTRLGYSGNIMELPAHLTLYEKRVAALVRMFLCQPLIALYSNCIEGVSPASRKDFVRVTSEFHTSVKERTSVYLTSSPGLATDLPVDMIVRTSEPVETDPRDI